MKLIRQDVARTCVGALCTDNDCCTWNEFVFGAAMSLIKIRMYGKLHVFDIILSSV